MLSHSRHNKNDLHAITTPQQSSQPYKLHSFHHKNPPHRCYSHPVMPSFPIRLPCRWGSVGLFISPAKGEGTN